MERTLLVPLLILIACEGGGPDSDPRCDALCTPTPLPYPDLGDTCDPSSNERCAVLCEARIAGTSNLCAECLLEGAVYDRPGFSEPFPPYCFKGTCIIQGRDGEICSFPEGDEDAHHACEIQVLGLQLVECAAPRFDSVARCAAVCDGGAP